MKLRAFLMALGAFCWITRFTWADSTPTPTPAHFDAHQLFEKAKKYYQEKKFKEAKSLLNQLVAKASPLEEVIPQAKLILANLEEDFTISTKRFQMLAQEYGDRPEGEEAEKDLGARYYLADKYPEAEESYKELIERYPKGFYATEARYWLGCSFSALDKNNEAMDQYQKVIHDSPDSLWAPKSYMGLGAGYLKKKDYPQAEKQYLKILDQYHFYDELNLTYFKLGQTYELEKKLPQAHAAYQTLVEKYPKSLEVEGAKERMKTLEGQVPGLPPIAEAQPVTPVVTPTLVAAQAVSTHPPEPTVVPKTDEPPALQGKPFHVQIGVYTRQDNVTKAQKEVKKAGYSSFVVTAKKKDIPYTYYKVRVGSFSDKKTAEKLAKELTRKTKEKVMVVED